MRNRSSSEAHRDAVARRIAELSRQIEASAAETHVVPDILDVAVEPAAGGDEWWGGYTHVARERSLSLVPDGDPRVEEPTVAAPVPLPERTVPPAPTVLPVPGRHAARRPREVLTALVPDTLRGRARFGPAQVSVVAVLVAVVLAFVCWRVVRDDPEPVATPVAVAQGESLAPLEAATATGNATESGAPTPSGVPATSASADVIVDVAGKVRHPGIVVLHSGARVVDAVRRAGGARHGVDLATLNLARLLVDGEQIIVGLGGTGGAPVAPPAAAPPIGSSAGPVVPVDLNLATQAELETLPDVGPVTAGAIIAWRDEHGSFTAVEELLEVDGIGDVTLTKLSPLVTV